MFCYDSFAIMILLKSLLMKDISFYSNRWFSDPDRTNASENSTCICSGFRQFSWICILVEIRLDAGWRRRFQRSSQCLSVQMAATTGSARWRIFKFSNFQPTNQNSSRIHFYVRRRVPTQFDGNSNIKCCHKNQLIYLIAWKSEMSTGGIHQSRISTCIRSKILFPLISHHYGQA